MGDIGCGLMAKPKWLTDRAKENASAERLARKLRYCADCVNYGPPVKSAVHRGKQITSIHECLIHPGCMNSEYSLSCEDYQTYPR